MNELEQLRLKLDKFHWALEAGDPKWKIEEEKWNYYRAKLLIFKTDLKKARNFYKGVIS